MSTSEHTHIPKLTGPDNYKEWADEILAAVLRKGAQQVLSGEEVVTKEPENKNIEDYVKWQGRVQYIAGLILGSTSPTAKVHLSSKLDGPVMWKELKAAYEQHTSAGRFNALEALIQTKQDNLSLSQLLGVVNLRLSHFISAQPEDYNHKKFLEELFCWVLIRALGPQHSDLRLSLIKEDKITKKKCIDQVTSVEEGLTGDKSVNNAFYASPSSSTAQVPPINGTPCVWCMSKGRTNVAATHSLQTCSGFGASLEHNKRNQSQPGNKSKPTVKQHAKQAVETVTEFAGTASSSIPANSTSSDDFWVSDSGATSHMTSHKHWIHDLKPMKVPIRLGDHSIIYSEGVGKVWFEPLLAGHPAPVLCLSAVLYVPRLKSNLLSIPFLTTQRDYEVLFKGHSISFMHTGQLMFQATINSSRIAKVLGRTLPAISVPQSAMTAALAAQDLQLWHKRFMHRNVRSVTAAIKNSVLGAHLTSDTKPPTLCIPCIAGKQHRDPFPSSDSKATRPMEIIYCDLRGPFHVQTHSHKVYWAVFTDLYSRWRYLALLSSKRSAELLEHYKLFEAQGKALHGQHASVVSFRCDGGGEFVGDLKRYLATQGTIYGQTTRNTPQQNGISERANRDIGDGLVSALVQSGLSDPWWGEAAMAFVYTSNHFPTAPLGDKTPYEMWYGSKPDVSNLHA